jgi:chaperone modulatory protein CbpM
MMTDAELCALIGRLDLETLRDWVESGLVHGTGGETLNFDDADVARVRLICELRYDMDVEEASLPLVMSLMDQLYDLRRSVRAISAAISEEPGEVRLRITSLARRHLRRTP